MSQADKKISLATAESWTTNWKNTPSTTPFDFSPPPLKLLSSSLLQRTGLAFEDGTILVYFYYYTISCYARMNQISQLRSCHLHSIVFPFEYEKYIGGSCLYYFISIQP